mgnify:CR=1 FL=1
MRSSIYILLGIIFGMAMYKAEAASWFRIYEMFSFQSFHMYGFIGTTLFIGIIGIQWMKRKGSKDIDGKEIVLSPKEKTVVQHLIGGTLFGLGWALVGLCPGPIFVMLGAGVYSLAVVIAFALLGTYLYGLMKDKLPH